jgi:EAL domain-containing protein (putative c-di-GMP-specific phosphodiesterase class I)
MISPHIFIALAERSGLISKIGNWVVYEACMQNKRWQDIGFEPMIVGINLSLVQFFDENLVEVVRDALETTGLDPCWLELEITESVSIQSSQNVAQKIDQLKEIGVKVAIDDFGSGFSSFGRLNSMHVDKLKIDMQFVHGINCNKTDEEIIKAITQLGKTLNIKILAEGVEDESQLSFLKENLCDEIQGFHFYKPMDASSIERILSEQSEVVLR